MKDLVTGAAGFIGSSLIDSLLGKGRNVVGVDDFSRNYDPKQKRENIKEALQNVNFEMRSANLLEPGSLEMLNEVDTVYHLAGQPGVQTSWGSGFETHLERNVLATQILLERCLENNVRRVVIASSSSVYGPTNRESKETDLPHPVSPYGVSKLAAEHLASVYAERGLDVISLRLFTVYGPRQRPDMSIHRMFNSALKGEPFPLWGEGKQRRSFTFVDDIVEVFQLAGSVREARNRVLNAGGAEPVELLDLIKTVEELVGCPITLQQLQKRPGDPDLTCASKDLVTEELGWKPKTPLEIGLRSQLQWHNSISEHFHTLQEVG
ncbi:MAG: NAD-dependent epimerase/dehydratase family protein [Acidimicrobiales bacterium]|nr:NAD-dependent epimerase/dehydratase family protein [Acidimicrobiales bacterium]|tara:strand:- start:958 stop:1923 length:966 start_codon:yes stop_codon:yes gene_type:complete